MINRLSIRNKKVIVILVTAAIFIPILIFIFASISDVKDSKNGSLVSPTIKPPLPTFPDAPRVENELIIQYGEGQEFDNLSSERQQEIMEFFNGLGVISQEKVFESSEAPLSGYYLLKLKDGFDIELVAQKIYELPEIVGGQPNFEVGIN